MSNLEFDKDNLNSLVRMIESKVDINIHLIFTEEYWGNYQTEKNIGEGYEVDYDEEDESHDQNKKTFDGRYYRISEGIINNDSFITLLKEFFDTGSKDSDSFEDWIREKTFDLGGMYEGLNILSEHNDSNYSFIKKYDKWIKTEEEVDDVGNKITWICSENSDNEGDKFQIHLYIEGKLYYLVN